MSAVSSPATDVDLLRAIRELADPAAHEAGSEVMFTGLLERLLDCEAVVVEGEVQFRRPANRPFGEREEVLCDLLRPHVSAWLAHQGESRARSGRSALTQRQLEILALVSCGMCNKEVARALGLTPATVRKHLESAFARLGVTSRTAAVAQTFGTDAESQARHV